jgi:hypothetical protein
MSFETFNFHSSIIALLGDRLELPRMVENFALTPVALAGPHVIRLLAQQPSP